MNRRDFIKASACVGTLATAGCPAAGAVAGARKEEEGAPAAGKDLGKARILPPGRYDAHIHLYQDTQVSPPKPERFAARLAEAGIAGGCVFSREQFPSPRLSLTTRMTPEQIVDNVIEWCSGSPTIYPFYWIDPSRPDAPELVDMAVEKGICGFKVIRNNGYPCDGYALETYRRIAHYAKPLTFHSGILYDGQPSSEYFRPVAFEPMLRVPRIRFCLAHISWPWCDECLAVFGKMRDSGWRLRGANEKASYPDVPKMFIDTTPGPKLIWRREAMMRIYQTQFRKPIYDRLMFGSDLDVHNYSADYCRKFLDFDSALFKEWGISQKEVDSYFRTALQNFLFGEE